MMLEHGAFGRTVHMLRDIRNKPGRMIGGQQSIEETQPDELLTTTATKCPPTSGFCCQVLCLKHHMVTKQYEVKYE